MFFFFAKITAPTFKSNDIIFYLSAHTELCLRLFTNFWLEGCFVLNALFCDDALLALFPLFQRC